MKIPNIFQSTIDPRFLEPYVIAEIGVNHGGNFDLAKKLIYLAKEGGADAAKFQTYKSDRLASVVSPAYWDTSKEKCSSQHQLFKQYDGLNRDDYEKLAEYCESIGIDFATTPFDVECLEWLKKILAYVKVASADITNRPLLEAVAKVGKPVLLSTGAATYSEIQDALTILEVNKCDKICLLHCVLNYPTNNNNANLNGVFELTKRFPNNIIGYSDHTLPQGELPALEIAYLFGAVILEKHFTHDKTISGNDHYHSMDKSDLISFRNRIKLIRGMIGDLSYKDNLLAEQSARLNARRSIVARNDIPIGKTIDGSDLDYKRPGTGISPMEFDSIIGMRAATVIKKDHQIQYSDLNKT